MPFFARVSLIGLLPCAVFAQPTAPKPTFEIADVHVSAKSTNPVMRGGVLRGSRYELRTASMLDLVSTAYGVERDKVLGGPSWLETDRFDIAAKAAPGTSPENVKLMLQALLADRFQLVIHNDTKALPGFALSLGKGKHKLKEASEVGNAGCQGQPQTPEPGVVPYAVVLCHGMTIESFAQSLRGMAGAYVTAPVTDMTGLKGAWDFELKWTARALLAQAGADGITLSSAIDKQLGLLLESRSIPLDVTVVDSVNRTPTANDPSISQNLPTAPPAEFEVATIKPSVPNGPQMARLQNGQLDTQGLPVKFLIRVAWDILSDELIVGGPESLDSTRYDITAKAFTDGAANAEIDIETLRLMLQGLLKERFKLAVHMEDREMNAYTLTTVKPKLKAADPLNRTGCKEGPAPAAPDARDKNPILSRLATCQNMTMAQFADRLQGIAPGYLQTPVMDATGLEGAFDFSLNFTPNGPALTGVAASPAANGGVAAALEPTGAIALFEALEKQMGLKLEKQKRKMPVLVVDHVEEKPTEN